jgi:L-threonylcarbamoyladenylate synthase
VAREEIERILGPLLGSRKGVIQAPGMLASHYAPSAKLRLQATTVEPGEALLAFGPQVPPGARMVRNLSPSGDVREAAANLFSMLRSLDKSGASAIAVMPINDRLARAAHPRQ